MSSGRGDTRAEFSRLLSADAPPHYQPKPLDIHSSHQLHTLISSSIAGSQDGHRVIYDLLPLLIQRFFGFAPNVGWLETGSALPAPAREALMNIIRPTGPVMAYCTALSASLGREPKVGEWRYEFPTGNIPLSIVAELTDIHDNLATYAANPSASNSPISTAFAPSLRRAAENDDDAVDVLLLSPTDYFFICMLSSPFHIHQNSLPSSARRQKRSASLPSTRAMYNQVLSEHVAHAWTQATSTSTWQTLFIPAAAEILFSRLAAPPSFDSPELTAATADAISACLISLRLSTPAELELPPTLTTISPSNALANFYAMVPLIIRNSLQTPPPPDSSHLPAMSALLRLLAFHIAPGSSSLSSSIKTTLLPRARKPASSTSSAPTFASLSSTLAQMQRSSTSLNTASDKTWRTSSGMTSRLDSKRDILRHAILNAVKLRLGANAEGVKALALVADAIRASGLDTYEGFAYNPDETRTYLYALAEQMGETGDRRTRSCIPVLSHGLGIRVGAPGVSGGVFSGVAEMVRGGGMPTQSPGSGSGKKGRLRELRRSEMASAVRSDVPVLGNVWERPFESDEIEFAVVTAYRLAELVEKWTGTMPDIRFAGRRSFIGSSLVLLFFVSACWTFLR